MISIKSRFLCFIAAVFAVALYMGTFGCSGENPVPVNGGIRPIVFVHGFAGSGDQFETQALRFASNGYPDNYFTGFEHNTINTDSDKLDRLDATIDAVLAETGADKVDLAGHSMGTGVSSQYLSDAAHAAKVAHYMNIDGMPFISFPEEIPVLNIKAVEPFDIIGAININLDQEHVQACSSAEAFIEMYKFLNNNAAPSTTEILPAASSTIQLKGRLVNFMSNIVPEDIILSIYQVNPDTGRRLSSTPDYTKIIASDGNFNFTSAMRNASYEFHVTRSETNLNGHYYYEPFVRTDTLIRLKFLEPDSEIDSALIKSDSSAILSIIRNKEMQGDGTNSVKVNGTELCNGILRSGNLLTGSGPIGLFLFDAGSDGENNLGSIATVLANSLASNFIVGLDFYIPASSSASGTIRVEVKGGSSSPTQVLNVPNWVSSSHKIVTQFAPF